jgi:hypothetical protein
MPPGPRAPRSPGPHASARSDRRVRHALRGLSPQGSIRLEIRPILFAYDIWQCHLNVRMWKRPDPLPNIASQTSKSAFQFGILALGLVPHFQGLLYDVSDFVSGLSTSRTYYLSDKQPPQDASGGGWGADRRSGRRGDMKMLERRPPVRAARRAEEVGAPTAG